MSLLSNNDLQFLCDSTGLSVNKLLSLDSDFDLIVDAIADRELTMAPISLSLFTKLTIFRESRAMKYPLTEKAYVASCVADTYPKCYKGSHYIIDRGTLTEKDGRYYLVLTSMFPEFIINKHNSNGAPNLDFYIKKAKDIFHRHNQEILASHLDEWIDLLYYIKINCWN